MPSRVEILSKVELFRKFFFRIEEATFRHERYDGTMSPPMLRLNFNRGDSVAALMHNPTDDTLIFTEQFRYPTYEKSTGWLMEIPAGTVEAGEKPEETMIRESIEETGFQPEKLDLIHTFFLSPGGTSERIFLYYVRLHPNSKVAEGGGVAHEMEDIQTIVMPVEVALAKMQLGEIQDAKTLIGLQWLQLHRNTLLK